MRVRSVPVMHRAGRVMRRASHAFAALGLATFADVEPASAQQTPVPSAEWEVPYGGASARPRDPYVGPDGNTYFVGQVGNYIARLDPRTGEFKKYDIDAGTNPHNLIVDPSGMVWFAGNANGMIGKLDPRTGAITRYPMPDPRVRDPHTLIFDAKGDIWFTAQNSGAVGHLETRTGKIRLAFTGAGTRPYGIVINSKGVPWFDLFGTNKVAHIDPNSFEITTVTLPKALAGDDRRVLETAARTCPVTASLHPDVEAKLEFRYE